MTSIDHVRSPRADVQYVSHINNNIYDHPVTDMTLYCITEMDQFA